MLPQFKNLQELTQKFSDEKICRKYLEEMIWKGNPTCPHCGQNKPYGLKDGKTYRCSNKDCKKDFTVTVGSIFENSKVSLVKWFMAIYIATNHKKGISSVQLAKDIGVRQATAWFMLHRIREMVRPKQEPILMGEVLIDHTYHGGREKNKSKFRRWIAHRINGPGNYDEKIPVFGLLQIGGEVRMIVVPDSRAETAVSIIEALVTKESTIISDGAIVFANLDQDYHKHVIVNHSMRQYVKNGHTTNHLESVFAMLKRSIYGIYHNVSDKHLQRYCEECSHRYNTRKLNDPARFNHVLRHSKGRLKYKVLTDF